jgi:hypothetical protein
MKPEVWLWVGILTGPIAWFINLEANFAIAPLACTARGKPLLYLISGLALLLTVAAGSISFGQWQATETNQVGEAIPFTASRRAMAVAGLGLNSLFFLVIVAQTVPNILLQGCE